MPLDRFKYMKLSMDLIPEEINKRYYIKDIGTEGWVCIQIQIGMYGLFKAGVLANRLLTTCLTVRGFFPFQFTPRLWCPISFMLVIDDFGRK